MATKSAPPDSELLNVRNYRRTRRPFWRLFGWGSAASIALAAVALTSQTGAGGQRLQLALAYVGEPVRAVAQIPLPQRAAEAETARLAAELRELAADRERLTARIASLERNLEDMTGSINKQSTQAAATPAAPAPPPAPSAPATAPTANAATPPPAPALPALTPLAIVPPAAEPAAARSNKEKSRAAEPLPEPIPLPPLRVAAAPASEPAAAPTLPPKSEFGIDLGGAANLEALRVHWAAMKAAYGPLLVGLHPVASPHPRRPAGVDYHLVLGPLPNFAAAARLCARIPVTRIGCRPAKFDGTHLAEH